MMVTGLSGFHWARATPARGPHIADSVTAAPPPRIKLRLCMISSLDVVGLILGAHSRFGLAPLAWRIVSGTAGSVKQVSNWLVH
jgi:hypothetical protein